jgi:hypothetical protein
LFRISVLLLALASPCLAATATTKFQLTNAGWTDFGAGPLHLTFRGQGVYAIADATPTLTGEGFRLISGDSVNVRTPSHVWGMATGAANVDAYVAPIN